jgi:hypothetical protein
LGAVGPAEATGGLGAGALSQQLALAQNAADTGEAARAATIAVEVDGWAEALGLARLSSQARRLLEQLSRRPAG